MTPSRLHLEERKIFKKLYKKIIQIVYKGEKYTGFGVEQVDGRYKYPSLKKDWYNFKTYNVYLFKNEEILKLENLDGELDLNVFIGTYGDSMERDKKYQSCYTNLEYLLGAEDNDKEVFKFKEKGIKSIDVLSSPKHYLSYFLPVLSSTRRVGHATESEA